MHCIQAESSAPTRGSSDITTLRLLAQLSVLLYRDDATATYIDQDDDGDAGTVRAHIKAHSIWKQRALPGWSRPTDSACNPQHNTTITTLLVYIA